MSTTTSTPPNGLPITDQPVRVTENALQRMVTYLGSQLPKEGCGFLIGPKDHDYADLFVPVPNVDPTPDKRFTMSTVKIARVNEMCDERGLEIRAVVHSHPRSEPVPSDEDLAEARDLTPGYVIASFSGQQPRVRAWRISNPYIGINRAHEVLLLTGTAESLTQGPPPPPAPWALSLGNTVEITYEGDSGTTRSATGQVMTSSHEEVVLRFPKSGHPQWAVNVGQIRHVHLLAESEPAKKLRREMIGYLRHAAAAAASGGLAEVPRLLAATSAAFPPAITISIKED